MKITILICTLILITTAKHSHAQQPQIKVKAFDGTIVAGYADKGAYVNCAGPAIKYDTPRYSILLGLLPSIKIKEDNSPVKNSIFTPTLGFGATLILRKHLVIQIPTFYIPKTSNINGKWTLGAGIGYKLTY